MHDWWMRYKKRELTEKDHKKIFWIVFFPYLFLSILGVWLIDAEMSPKSDKMMGLSVPIFFLPWFVIILSIQAHTPPVYPSIQRRVFRFISAIVITVFAAGGGFGYINIANALTGSSTAVAVSGPIIEMKRYSAGWSGPRRIITIHFENRDIKLSLKLEEYNQIKIGDIYSRQMKLGGLGYYYRWGLAFWKG